MDALIAGGAREVSIDRDGLEVVPQGELEDMSDGEDAADDEEADHQDDGGDRVATTVPGADVGLDALEYVPLPLSKVCTCATCDS